GSQRLLTGSSPLWTMRSAPATFWSQWGRETSIGSIMSLLDSFAGLVRQDEPLGPYTWMGIGGPAQYFVEPRNAEELAEVVRACAAEAIPVNMLGGGSNLLVRDEGIGGAVIRLAGDEFSRIVVDGERV